MRALAGWCVRHRRIVVIGWLVALDRAERHQPERRQHLQGQLQPQRHAELRMP